MAGRAADIRDQAEEWPVLSSTTPFRGKITSVRTDEIRMPDGSTAKRDYQLHPGSVAVLALDDDRRVLVIRQYRHPVRQRLWEIPAGLLDVPGENPLHAAQRELYEEAHCKADEWRVLVDIYTSPGSSDEALRIFLARGLGDAEGDRHQAEGEESEIEIDRVPLDEVVGLALTGQLHNPTLVTGALAAHAALQGGAALRDPEATWTARPFPAP
jgi:ADP-ribose pyrophosphatase